jgi:protein gp37
MAHETKIEWTTTYLDHQVLWKGKLTNEIPGATFNPWWGCVKVSPACKNCYAEHLSDVRFGNNNWGPGSDRMFFKAKHWSEPKKWDRECKKFGIKRKVFCASMADVFEENEILIEERKKLWQLIDETPNLIWLLLTKRPENIVLMIPEHWKRTPPTNVWIGTTVESQEWAEKRIPELLAAKVVLKVPAFLSCEPLLGPLDLHWYGLLGFQHARMYNAQTQESYYLGGPCTGYPMLDWVIAGGESGDKARPTNGVWFRSLRSQCKDSGTPFFFKQWGEYQDGIKVGKRKAGRLLDGMTYNGMPDNKLGQLQIL